MVIKTSFCVALACAGLGPVAAGWAIHATRAGHGATADGVVPWGRLAAVSGSAEPAPAALPRTLRLGGRDAGEATAAVKPTAAETTVVPEVAAVPSNRPVRTVALLNPSVAEDAAVPVSAAPTEASLGETASAPATEGVPISGGAADGAAERAPIDINTASVAALNRIPGFTNAGRAIVSHRPYRRIEDLLAHRVLKSSDFQRVKAWIKV